jgi:hypothetical protein
MRRPWVAVALLVLVAVAIGLAVGQGASPSPGPGRASAGPSSAPSGSVGPSALTSPGAGPTPASARPSPGAAEPLAALLGLLRVAPEDRAGYDRSLFVHWIDANRDGCDTRREVLIQEAIVRPTVGPGCRLSGGTWFSLYDGLSIRDASKLQIDHVVALAEAWDSGASAWTPNRRMRFANDLDAWFALIAVSGSSNQSKSDRDPADWLPPAPAAECPFIGAWIATKVRWDLAVDPRERAALLRDVADCRSTTMPYLPAGSAGEIDGAGPTTWPSGEPAAPAGSAGCDPAYPTVCIPPSPPDLDCTDVPYRNFEVLPPDPHHFDGDRDGIGCET